MIFFIIILFVVATVLLLFYNVLFIMATKVHEKELADFEYRRYKNKFILLLNKYNSDAEILKSLKGFEYTWRKTWHSPKSSEKKAKKIKKSMTKLKSGNYNGINFLVLPGYAFLDRLKIDANNKYFQKIMRTYSNLSGREYASANTKHLLACMVAVAIGLTATGMLVGILLIGLESGFGFAVILLSPIFAFAVSFSLLQGINSKTKARKEAITRDFAQVATEIALLTSSGMEIFRAWDTVCQDKARNSELYREMRQTSKELNNGFDINSAMENFIKRCFTKETTKFGASIIQGIERGNAELSIFLTELSRETWEERKRHARSLGEKAKSKLMLPMVLIFIGILLLIGVPIALGMGTMGF